MAIFDRNLGCRPLKPPVFPGLLVDRAKARKGQSILIHAGSGGLGSFAIQYAKHELGLHVTTTTSSRNAHWVRELGADVIVAYDRENYASLPARYDIVFDTLGGPTTSASFSVLKQGGTVVSVMGPPDRAFARQVGANLALSFVMWCIGLPMQLRARRVGGHYFRFLTESSWIQLEHVGRVVDAGKVRTVVEIDMNAMRMMYAVAPNPTCDGTDHGDPARPALHHRGQQELSQPDLLQIGTSLMQLARYTIHGMAPCR